MIAAGLDIGARHADLALRDGDALSLSKHALSEHTAEAALAALDAGLAQAGQHMAALEELRLCQTWGLNAVLAREIPPVTLVTTRGFGDVLTLARQDRADLYDPVARSSAPVHLAGAIVELDERMDAQGEVVTPPDLSPLHDLPEGPVAVCLLNAHVNGAHERAVAEALPGRQVSLSHRVDCAPREYERTVATCLEASLHATLAPVLAAFRAGLARRGFAGRLLLADSTGMLADAPPHGAMLAAGPAVAATAAGGFDGAAIGVDLGSRSMDLVHLRDGRVVSRKGSETAGIPLRQVAADTCSVGLGGQSRAVADGPTVDAALTALGRLQGGRGAAPDAASAAETIASMSGQIRDAIIGFAVARNLDPYAVPIVVMGGLGALLATDIAEALAVPHIHLAPAAATAGALALLSAPEVIRRSHPVDVALAGLSADDLSRAFARLRGEAPVGFAEQWTAEIAPAPKAEPERVPLGRAAQTPAELAAAWEDHMLTQTGVRPAQGTLTTLELALLRPPPTVPYPTADLQPPSGWRAIPCPAGGVRLERVT